MKRATLFVFALVLLRFTGITQAQNNTLKVEVWGKSENPAVRKLLTKIESSSRYGIVSNNRLEEEKVVLIITCSKALLKANVRVSIGYVCVDAMEFGKNLSYINHITFCDPKGEECAEEIFEHFVKYSQPDALESAKAGFMHFSDGEE